jgi:hypothetical protein
MQVIKPKAMKLKLSQVLELFAAYQAFGGYNKTVGDDEKSVLVPFDIGGLTRVAIGMNASALRPLVEAHNDALSALRKQHAPDGFNPKTATAAEKAQRIAGMQAYTAEEKKLSDAMVEVKQRLFNLDDLKPDTNPYDPGLFTLLEPVLVITEAK